MNKKRKINIEVYGLIILLLLTFAFITFGAFVPNAKETVIEQKKKQIQAIVEMSMTILDKYYNDYKKGKISEKLAQEKAKEMLRNVRYGIYRRDYVSIIDFNGISVMHPYGKFEGTNISGLKDKRGKYFIKSILDLAKKQGAGYAYYHWNYKDQQTMIVPKLTFNMVYANWKWIVGTGVYMMDIERDIDILKSKILIMIGVLSLVTFIITVFIVRSLQKEK